MFSPVVSSKKRFDVMFAKRSLNLDYCYYGEKENIVTHFKKLNDLCDYLNQNPRDIKKYVSARLNTDVFIEGDTLKVKGLLTRPIIDTLLNEMKMMKI